MYVIVRKGGGEPGNEASFNVQFQYTRVYHMCHLHEIRYILQASFSCIFLLLRNGIIRVMLRGIIFFKILRTFPTVIIDNDV